MVPLLLKKYFIFALVAGICISAASHESSAGIVGAGDQAAGVPSRGEKGVGETVEEIMARENLSLLRGPKKKIVLPFRTDIRRRQNKQNPESQQQTSTPPLLDTALLSPSYAAPLTAQTLDLSFTGATLADTGFFPPDSMGAAGPTQFIVAVNGRIRSFNKTTGVADGVLDTDMDTFFSSVMASMAGTFTADPRIRYDRLSGRWMVTMIDVPGGTGSGPNNILLAVSDSGTITNSTVWTFFHFPGDTGDFADYDTLGIDANALYIGVNIFDSQEKFVNSTAFVVRKSSILGAGPIVVTAFRDLIGITGGPYSPQGVDNYDPSATEGYFIGVDGLTYGTLMLRRVSNPGGTPTMSGNILITVPPTSYPLNVSTLGGTRPLDALDDRLFAAHLRNGYLWTAHNIGVNSAGTVTGTITRDGSRWYQLQGIASSGTPTVAQSGTVFDPTSPNDTNQLNYWIPTIMVSGQGHASMGFSVAGASSYANAGTTGRLSGDSPGTMQTPVPYTNSSTVYNPPGDTINPFRWGDYSYTSLDPDDDMTMWTIQEFCDSTDSYGVRVARLLAPPPATPSSASPASITPGQSSVNVLITGTQTSGSGFFDPGSGFPRRISASVSGGVTVNSVTYTDPTHVTLNISTVGAAVGPQNVAVTNPDGQSSTGNGILMIAAAEISISPTSKNFGNVTGDTSSSQGFTITNTGRATLAISSTSLSSGDSAMFSVTPGTCPSLTPTISAGQSCTINVTFTPTSAGTKSTTLVITSNAYNSPTLDVGLSGTGVYYTLTIVGAAGSAAGTVTDGSSINCSIASDGTTSGVCSKTDSVNMVVLTASPAMGSSAVWSGCTPGAVDTCNVTINANTTVTAGFSLFPVKRVEGGITYSTIQEAFSDRALKSGDTIETQETTFNESPDFNLNYLNISVLLKGGFDASFASQTGYSTITGTLTISMGTLTVEDIRIQ